MKKSEGITLVSLIVTVIILIILAGVTINLAFGNMGIIKKAQYAIDKTENSDENVLEKLNETKEWADKNTADDEESPLPNTTETFPYYPSYKYDKVEGSDLDNGLIIEDRKGNQFVWVEVPRNTTVYKNAGLNITDFTTSNLAKIKNDLLEYAKDYKVTGYEDEWYDGCGISSANEYTELYNKMLKSVYQNGGFWIGRYEMGIKENTVRSFGEEQEIVHSTEGQTPAIQANKIPYNWITGNQAQRLANTFSTTDYTASMLFGIQWELTCKHIETKAKNPGTTVSTIKDAIKTNSIDWGNYQTATFKVTNTKAMYSEDYGATWKKVPTSGYTKPANTNILLTTGADSRNCILNIYDFAGNVWEKILQKYEDDRFPSTGRGGSFSTVPSKDPAYAIGGVQVNYNYFFNGTRVTIF